METKEQIRSMTNEAYRIGLALLICADEYILRTKPVKEISQNIDSLSRELSFIADSLKTKAYELQIEEQTDRRLLR